MKNEELSCEDIKRVALNMLKTFDEVCSKHGIIYSAFAGTLLGAVRHQGFIPWDDDIDIFMFRDEYAKLTELIRKEDPFCGEILLFDVNLNKKYSLPLAKLIDSHTELKQKLHAERCSLGVYIDIFIYDRVPEDMNVRRKLFEREDKLQRIWYLCDYLPTSKGKTWKGKIKYLVRRVLNLGFARFVTKRMEHVAKLTNGKNKNSFLLGNLLYCSNREGQMISHSDLLNVVRTKFEEQEICIIKEYDSFLTRYFGDYMKLPPVEQRVSTHSFTCKWIDDQTS